MATTRPQTTGPELSLAAVDIESRLKILEEQVARLEKQAPDDRVCLVVFSGELDRVLEAFVIATGAAALGQQVSMFFTFWGMAALRRRRQFTGKRFHEKLMALVSPGSSGRLPLSRMNLFGAGSQMMRRVMRNKHVASLEDLMRIARRMGARIVACETSRDLMGLAEGELPADLEFGCTAGFLTEALRSRMTLLI